MVVRERVGRTVRVSDKEKRKWRKVPHFRSAVVLALHAEHNSSADDRNNPDDQTLYEFLRT